MSHTHSDNKQYLSFLSLDDARLREEEKNGWTNDWEWQIIKTYYKFDYFILYPIRVSMCECALHSQEIHFGLVLQEILFFLSFRFIFLWTFTLRFVDTESQVALCASPQNPIKVFFYGDFDNATFWAMPHIPVVMSRHRWFFWSSMSILSFCLFVSVFPFHFFFSLLLFLC